MESPAEVGDNHMESTHVPGIMIIRIAQINHKKSEQLDLTELGNCYKSNFVPTPDSFSQLSLGFFRACALVYAESLWLSPGVILNGKLIVLKQLLLLSKIWMLLRMRTVYPFSFSFGQNIGSSQKENSGSLANENVIDIS